MTQHFSLCSLPYLNVLFLCLACSRREYSASSGEEINEKMSASSFAPGSHPGKVSISGWKAKEAIAGEWIEYDTSHKPRLVVETRTLPFVTPNRGGFSSVTAYTISHRVRDNTEVFWMNSLTGSLLFTGLFG